MFILAHCACIHHLFPTSSSRLNQHILLDILSRTLFLTPEKGQQLSLFPRPPYPVWNQLVPAGSAGTVSLAGTSSQGPGVRSCRRTGVSPGEQCYMTALHAHHSLNTIHIKYAATFDFQYLHFIWHFLKTIIKKKNSDSAMCTVDYFLTMDIPLLHFRKIWTGSSTNTIHSYLPGPLLGTFNTIKLMFPLAKGASISDNILARPCKKYEQTKIKITRKQVIVKKSFVAKSGSQRCAGPG